MKFILIFLLFGFTNLFYAQSCQSLHKGTFRSTTAGIESFTIARKSNIQIEHNEKTGTITQFDIKWITKCKYIIYNPKVLHGKINYPPEITLDTLYNEIISINKTDHTVKSYFKKYDYTINTGFRKVK